MNYFPFDPDPALSAVALDDKRLTRVFHEATMTLSVAQFRLTGDPGPYSPRTPIPRALLDWVMGEGETWFVEWTRFLLAAMVERVGQVRVNGYACFNGYMALRSRFRDERIAYGPPATFPNLARAAIKGLDYSDRADVHEAYREYLRVQWREHDKRAVVWTYHGPPAWADNGIEGELRLLGLLP